MSRLFGTDGVRGIANCEPMTPEMAMKLGKAAASLFQHRSGRHRIVIGKDTRLSGYMFESALTSGICSMGVDVLLVGPLPTPAVSFLIRALRADAGIVISASHNPYEDNGIKFFSRDGFKLPDEMQNRMEELIFSGKVDDLRVSPCNIGKAYRVDDAEGRYIEFVKRSLPREMSFDGLKVVVDCANGAAYKSTPQVLRELGAEVITLGDKPNGVNINLNCGSLHPEAMVHAVVETGADVGIAHDGDADRAVFASEKGTLVDGDAIIATCALDMKREGRLNKETLVTTVMSNLGLDMAMKKAGIRVVRTPVGDRYVLEKIREEGLNFGGEQSGHLIFLDHNTTGDGVITALQILALMVRTGKPLSELSSCITLLPQVLLNVKVREVRDPFTIPGFERILKKEEKRLAGSGRILVRQSGTEPVIRIMVEGRDEEEIRGVAETLAGAIRAAIGSDEKERDK